MNLETNSRKAAVLTIAGSDSGAGAGIQADLKTFAAHGAFGVSALTMVTAQSTTSVDEVHQLPVSLLLAQLNSIFDDFRISAAKTGALGTAETIEATAAFLKGRQ